MADEIPTTPEQVRELLEWARDKHTSSETDRKFHTTLWAPDYLILGYLAEECGIDPAIIREQLVAIGADEAVAQVDSWGP